jgi:zinc and cadmium transporter
MSVLGYILLFTFLGSIASLIGGLILLYKEKIAIKTAHYLTSFAAGVLLGTAFFDLLPEAFEEAAAFGGDIFLWALIGFSALFLVERFIHWFHHHASDHTSPREGKSIIPLLIISDVAHNFIDGIVIALTFMVSIPLGVVTSLAIVAHEVPQEIGDFAIMLHRGLKKKKVIAINVLSALVAVAGAVITFVVGENIKAFLPAFLALAAGFFIYIAASDLIPEIHHEDKKDVALIQTILLFLGMLVIYLLVNTLE